MKPTPSLPTPARKLNRDRMSVEEAATFLGLSASTLNHMRCQGRGPRFHRMARRVFYRHADLTAYMDACAVETADSNHEAA